MSEEYLTAKEVQAWLKISKATLQRWRADQTFPVSVLGTKIHRYPRSAIEAWVAERSQRKSG